jgi:HAD superfamily hydrolase (TIGR01509 family)
LRWVDHFQLFLFDMDGLLVNTEELHYLAYKQMCANRGIELKWDFERYCQAAHYDSTALRDQIYAAFPALKVQEPRWEVLYEEKKKAIVDLIQTDAVHLMPGVEELLVTLANKGIKRCVVTHSADILVDAVRKKNPLLDSIPVWITRHDYTHPKPHPECYQKAIAQLAKTGDKVIGFEDTPRGLAALLQTQVKPVLISTIRYPEIPSFLEKGASHFTSLKEIPEEGSGVIPDSRL